MSKLARVALGAAARCHAPPSGEVQDASVPAFSHVVLFVRRGLVLLCWIWIAPLSRLHCAEAMLKPGCLWLQRAPATPAWYEISLQGTGVLSPRRTLS